MVRLAQRYHIRYQLKVDVVVVDTNVLVSAVLNWENASRRIVELCFLGEIQPLGSNPLYAEYEDVFERDHIFEKSPISKAKRDALLDAFFSVCLSKKIYYSWRPNLRDDKDEFLIELAIAGNASTIITKNLKDFRQPELRFPHIQTVTPMAYLQRRA